MNDLLSVMLSNPHLGPQHYAQDGMNRGADLTREDLLLQELAKQGGAVSAPINPSMISAGQGLNPLLIALLLGGGAFPGVSGATGAFPQHIQL